MRVPNTPEMEALLLKVRPYLDGDKLRLDTPKEVVEDYEELLRLNEERNEFFMSLM